MALPGLPARKWAWVMVCALVLASVSTMAAWSAKDWVAAGWLCQWGTVCPSLWQLLLVSELPLVPAVSLGSR